MKPWRTLGRAPGHGGGELVLQERDGTFVIRSGGRELMSSRAHGSEEELARAVLEGRRFERPPRVLIGGLGLGYTLRATLELLPPGGAAVVSELSEAVVTWNRGVLATLSGGALEDPRVRVEAGDVRALLGRTEPGAFDALLLDVDNGPSALSAPGNAALYGERGIALCRSALGAGGMLGVWSAGPDAGYLRRLKSGGFDAQMREVQAHPGSPTRHTLFIARRAA